MIVTRRQVVLRLFGKRRKAEDLPEEVTSDVRLNQHASIFNSYVANLRDGLNDFAGWKNLVVDMRDLIGYVPNSTNRSIEPTVKERG